MSKKRTRLPLRWARKLHKMQGGKCACGCGTAIVLGPTGKNWQDEHKVPLGLGGTNALKNRELRYTECAKRKTFAARGRHTTIDSDIHAIAKARRISKGKMRVVKRQPGAKPITKTRWPRGRKLQSRPFMKKPDPIRHPST